jgi:hypothetical protein
MPRTVHRAGRDVTETAVQGPGRLAASPDQRVLGVKAGQLGGGRAKLGDTIDVITLQTLARRGDIAELTAGYGLVVAESATTSRPPRSRTLSPAGGQRK